MTNDEVNFYLLLVQGATLVVQVLAAVGLGVGLIFTYRQIGSTNGQIEANTKQKTAEYITRLQESFFANKDALEMYYSIEYSEFLYSKEFHGSSDEKSLDALLYHLNTLADYYLLSELDEDAMGNFAYRYLVVYQNEEVQKYLAYLDIWYAQRRMKGRAFNSFRTVGIELEQQHYKQELLQDLA